MTTKITGAFHDREHVQMAVDALLEAHYDPEEIAVVVTNGTGSHPVQLAFRTYVLRGAAIGAVFGAALGWFIALLASNNAIADPQLSALGTGALRSLLQATIGGLGFGALVGGLAGLANWQEVPELEPEEVQDGEVLVTVNARHHDAAQIQETLGRIGARRVTLHDD